MAAQVTRRGFLDMQVCVPAGYTDEQALEFAESQNPCGTEGGWMVRKEGSKYLAGAPERRECEEREGYVHITLDA